MTLADQQRVWPAPFELACGFNVRDGEDLMDAAREQMGSKRERAKYVDNDDEPSRGASTLYEVEDFDSRRVVQGLC